MGDTYSWTLDEYLLRCEDGVSIAEIVAESPLDRDVFSDVLRRWGYDHVTVIDAGYVNVTAEECRAAGAGSGVKAALLTIAAGLELRATEQSITAVVAVVVDRDYDADLPASRFLYVTDGHSMESYLMNEDTIDRFLSLGLGRPPLSGRPNGQDVLERLLPAASDLAALRIGLASLVPPAAPPRRWTKYLTTPDTGFMALASADLLSDLLRTAGRAEELAEAQSACQATASEVLSDPVTLVRGHDFIRLLHLLLQSPWGQRVTGANLRTWPEERLTRNLFLALPPVLVDASQLFTQLRTVFALPV